MDTCEKIVVKRIETFRHLFFIGDHDMTSTELKYQARLQSWATEIQECRSSGLSDKLALGWRINSSTKRVTNIELISAFPSSFLIIISKSAKFFYSTYLFHHFCFLHLFLRSNFFGCRNRLQPHKSLCHKTFLCFQ